MKRITALFSASTVLCAFAVYAHSGPVTAVTVRDKNFEVVKKLQPQELADFQRLWDARQKTAKAQPPNSGVHYKLDIERGSDGARWLYQPTGNTAVVLSHKKQSAYTIPEQEAFNVLLGIGGQ